MIKELFDIEPIQKNTLIMFLALFCVSFLQIYLFKQDVIEKGIFLTIGVSLALTVAWTVLNLPSMIVFISIIQRKQRRSIIGGSVIKEYIVLGAGFIIIGWVLLLSYVAYELELEFKNLIRAGLFISFFKLVLWSVISYKERPGKEDKP